MAPVPPPTIKASAGTTLDTLPAKEGQGLRLDFAHDDADLTPQTADAVKALVAAAPKDDATTYNVLAYAAGVPEDPSTARRLSLQRALSVRSALMAYGVPSTHIYLRALGEQAGDGPADRVDVAVMGANAAGARNP
jgi:outer membrane protein OmpA-like peptidoglycan-associated protein